jgi:nucleotide-binding universal stress UspA family protein
LLVLGTHGYGAIGRALIGSVTSRVVRAATCPMLLVPPQLAMTTAGRER